MGTLTIVGLGPGDWGSLTLDAVEALREAREVYVQTATQPRIESIRHRLPNVTFHSFDSLSGSHGSLPEIHRRLSDEVLRLAGRPEGVTYAVPGSPSLGETTIRLLLEVSEAHNIDIRVIQGLSHVEPLLAAGSHAEAGWIEIIDAARAAAHGSENAVGETPGEEGLLPWRAPITTEPLLITHLYDRSAASGIKQWLGRYYPDEHPIAVVQAPGGRGDALETVPLHDLERLSDIDHGMTIYVPPLSDLDNVRTFAGLLQLTRRLRGPGGCPWDQEQTHASLKPHLLEETYEVLDALDGGDSQQVAEELGDLLYQITIHSQVAAEAGEFAIEDVIESIVRKMIGRHPHVFGDMRLDSAQDVRHAWEGLKQRQKPKRSSVMEEIPRGLPALPQSNLMQKRAASVGFEWPSVTEVIAKVEEELRELLAEIGTGASKEEQREELGDILFALVSVARHLRIDPEEALRLANRKFSSRFRHVETSVAGEGKSLRELSSSELDNRWREAKTATGSGVQ